MNALQGLNPSSSMFQNQAIQNLGHIGMGTVTTQKEVTKHDETQENRQLNDQVDVSSFSNMEEVSAEDMVDNASHAGALGEMKDKFDDDDDDDSINGGNYYQDNEDYEGQGVDGQKRLRDMQDLEPSQVQRLNEMDDDFLAAKKILSDVPARSLKPAENYVASMVQGERPADTLASLTPVEGVNQVEFTPAESMGILDIHDSKNEPIVADLEDGLDPEQKQNLAADYMNAAINSLPDDRKAIVSELKNAVENWANANGQDPKAAFAEKLRDLAAGWDDESLNAVAQTYVDADREIAASTAG